jgi:hypothetical protein
MAYRNRELSGHGQSLHGHALAPRRSSLVAALLVLVLAAMLGPSVLQADDLDDLKNAVADSQSELAKSDKAERDILKEISENNAAQKKAKDAGKDEEYQRLKSRGIELKTSLSKTTTSRQQAERNLANKRGALRKEASKVAEEQIGAQGDANSRAKRAGDAVEIWKEALGELLVPPEIRKGEGLDDDEMKAQKQDDKQRLNDFITWAGTEKANIETEIKRAEALVKAEDKFKGADAQARLMNDAKSLKGTLETRNRQLSSSVKTAQERLRSLEK